MKQLVYFFPWYSLYMIFWLNIYLYTSWDLDDWATNPPPWQCNTNPDDIGCDFLYAFVPGIYCEIKHKVNTYLWFYIHTFNTYLYNIMLYDSIYEIEMPDWPYFGCHFVFCIKKVSEIVQFQCRFLNNLKGFTVKEISGNKDK